MYDDSQLRSRLSQVLAFAADGLAKLDDHARIWAERRDSDRDAFLRRRDKVAAEALLLAYLSSRVARPDAVLLGAVRELIDRAEEQIATGRNEAILRRFPQTATTLGLGFVLLAQLGRGRGGTEELLRTRLRRGWATVSERTPYRLMDSRWTYGLLDPTLLGAPDELLPFSTLAGSPHPLQNLSEDDYALTHALFYVTDFGRRAAPRDLEPAANQLLDPFLAWNAVRLDFDLLVEFLIAAHVLRAAPSPAFRFGWQVLERGWEQEGGLVGPEYSPARVAGLDAAEAEAYAFEENYHTVFCGGILCAVALCVPRPMGATPRQLPRVSLRQLGTRCLEAASRMVRPDSRSQCGAFSLPAATELPEWTVARLMQVLETPHDQTPLWLRVAVEGPLSRDEVAAVLHDALLVASARQYRLVHLAEALAAAASHASLRSFTFVRSLEFLLDQQLEGGFLGIQGLLAGGHPLQPAEEAQASLANLLQTMGTSLTA